ncbi:MAG: hypothetical protein EOO61_08760 [Hymenobacter sp.]|nr:MAG: hypothetical protein EOO61_08760 [Hymenobacter sp.]
MLTDTLLLPQQQEHLPFLRKRVTRILWPFLFWSAIYISYEYSLRLQNGNILAPVELLRWVYSKLQHGAAYHLWYVYTILGLYALMPVLKRWIQNAPDIKIRHLICVWDLTLLSSYYIIARYGIAIDLHYFSGFLSYLVLGYFITFTLRPSRWLTWAAIAALGLDYGLTAAGTYYLSRISLHTIETTYGNLTPNVALMAVGSFYLLRHAS